MPVRKRETTEVRQQQITEAALQVIGEKGIRGATTVEIASAAGLSEGNLYRHFKSKEDIIGAVISKIGSDLAMILETASECNDPMEMMEDIFKKHLYYIEEHIGIPRVIFSEEVLVLNQNLRSKVRVSIMDYFKGISAIVVQGQEAGAIDRELDPNAVAGMFIGTINFTAIRWVMNDFPACLTTEGESLWKTFEMSISSKS